MSETTWAGLRELLVARYDELRERLRRRLGSDELARESLHETYLHLSQSGERTAVQRPESYLFRIALNLAVNHRRAIGRQATPQEIEAAIELVDETVQTEKTVEARLDLESLERAIEELPPRQRNIFFAVRVQDVPIQEVANSLGISRRFVEIELKRALAHCAERLDRTVTRRFGPRQQNHSNPLQGDREVNSPPAMTPAKGSKR
jgi:RNA polymerase sigma factor (sigma-70 family)